MNFADSVGRSIVLHEAVRGGHGQLVKELLLAGASMDSRDVYGCISLHNAATSGLDGVVSYLLLKGAEKDARDNDSDWPLMLQSTWLPFCGNDAVDLRCQCQRDACAILCTLRLTGQLSRSTFVFSSPFFITKQM